MLHTNACLPAGSRARLACCGGTHRRLTQDYSTHGATPRCCCAADTERRLTKRCRELGAELVGSAAKVAAALRLGEDDAAAIAALKAEIEKAWRLVDASADKARPSPTATPAQCAACRLQGLCLVEVPLPPRVSWTDHVD